MKDTEADFKRYKKYRDYQKMIDSYPSISVPSPEIEQYYLLAQLQLGHIKEGESFLKKHPQHDHIWGSLYFLKNDFQMADYYFNKYGESHNLYCSAISQHQFQKAIQHLKSINVPTKLGSYLRKHKIPMWQKQPIKNKRILIISTNQGIGDNLFYARYLPYLETIAKDVFFLPIDDALSFLKKIISRDKILNMDDPIAHIDFAIPLFAIHSILPTNWEELSAPPLLVESYPSIHIEDPLSKHQLKIGIAWQGSKTNGWDKLRSIPLGNFIPLLKTAGARFYSLQKESSPAEKEILKNHHIDEPRKTFQTIERLANLIKSMDLIISVDSMIAHLSGILKVPCWNLLSYNADWRWIKDKKISRFYPSMRLFRQTKKKYYQWEPIIEKVAEELAKKIQKFQTPLLKNQSYWARQKRIVNNKTLEYKTQRPAFTELLKMQLYQKKYLPDYINLSIKEKNYKNIIRYSQNDAELGFAYLQLKKQDIAYPYLLKAHHKAPNDINITLNLLNSAIYSAQSKVSESLIKKMIKKKKIPKRFFFLYAQYCIFNQKNNEGIKQFKKWKESYRDIIDFLQSYGYLLYKSNQFTHAAAIYNQLKEKTEKHFALFGYAHLNGEWSKGNHYYEERFENRPHLIQPIFKSNDKWNKEPLRDKTILIIAEQGLGDSLFYARYLHALKPYSPKKVIFLVQKDLKAIFKQQNSFYQTLSELKEILHYDYWYPLQSIAYLLALSKTESYKLPYNLTAPPLRINATNDKLLKIGLFWQGRKSFSNDLIRSATLKEFEPLFQLSNCLFIPLTQNPDPEELERYNLSNIRKDFTNIHELASLIQGLDLIITVDSMIAHLAGCLNVATYLLIPEIPDWRWGLQISNSNWYSSITLFRKPCQDKNWTTPIHAIKEKLKQKLVIKLNGPLLIEKSKLSKPEWSGRPSQTKTLLIIGNGTLQDQLYFIRFIPHIRNKFKHIYFYCEARSAELFLPLGKYAQLIKQGDNIPKHDVWVQLTSLLLMLKPKKRIIPLYPPYPLGGHNVIKNNKIAIFFDQTMTEPKLLQEKLSPYTIQKINAFTVDSFKKINEFKAIITNNETLAAIASNLGQPVFLFLSTPHHSLWGGSEKTPFYPSVTIYHKKESSAHWTSSIKKLILKIQALNGTTDLQKAPALYHSKNYIEAYHAYERLLSKAALDQRKKVKLYRQATCLYHAAFYKDAILFYKAVLAQEPNHIESQNALSSCYYSLGEKKQALKIAFTSFLRNPRQKNLYDYLFQMLLRAKKLRKMEEIITIAEKNINTIRHQFNKAILYEQRNDIPKAIQLLKSYLNDKPQNPITENNIYLLSLKIQDFQTAKKFANARFKVRNPFEFKCNFPKAEWAGEGNQTEKTVLIVGEQGLGDRIQLMRFIPHLEPLFKKIKVLVHSPTYRIFKAYASKKIEIISSKNLKQLPEHDIYIPLLNLIFALKLTSAKIKTYKPNLPLAMPIDENNQKKIFQNTKFKIGFNMLGNWRFENDHNRSFDLFEHHALFSNKNAIYYNLNLEEDTKILKENNILNLRDHAKTLEDLASAMLKLDLVITVDSMIAHLSASLNIETWILLPYCSDWRWGCKGRKSDWYPSARLFRQNKTCQWSPVVKKVKQAIDKQINAATHGKDAPSNTLQKRALKD